VTEGEARFVEAAHDLEELLQRPGFKFLIDIIRDEFDPARVFGDATVRPGWTFGEEYAYAKGKVDAVLEIIGADQMPGILLRTLEKAKEIIDQNKDSPLADESEAEDRPNYQ